MHGRRLEVRVSYAGRMGIALVIGALLMLPVFYVLVTSLLAARSDDGPTAKAAACAHLLTVKRSLTCTDTAPMGGRAYRVDPDASGTYAISVQDTGSAPTPMCITVERSGTKVAKKCAASAAAAVVSVELDLNAADLRVEDASYAGKVDHPYTLTIARAGAKDESGAGVSALPLVALAVLPLVFLVFIPIALTAEKKRIPRYLDASGVTMRNGAHFPWHTYRGVRVVNEVRRGNRPFEVGIELLFATGSATLRYRPIVNGAEVFPVIEQLKLGRNPFV